MFRYIRTILHILFVLPFLTGCTDNMFISYDATNGEYPVEFELLFPETSTTRAFDKGTDIKTSFKENDVIHVLGTFNTESLQEDGTYILGKEKRYGALKYDGKKWEPAEGNTLTWPTIATDGQFEAYYISESNGVLTGENPSETYSLSDLTPTPDPLKATPEDNISYGHAVRLDFYHICAHLMLVDLEPMVANKYWFYTDGPIDPETERPAQFNNAYRIFLGKSTEKETEGQPTLNFEFCQQPDAAYNNRVYISANTIEAKIEENGIEKVISKAGYFLEPGFYETFSVCYPAGTSTTYDYLKYDYNNIPKEAGGVGVENNRPDLEANTTYTLNITKSPGVEIRNPPAAGGWDESDEYLDVDVEEFLKAVNNKTDYRNEEDVLILEKTANGVKLLHNVDFKNLKYGEGFSDKTFYPNILEGTVFDGDYHYIRSLASPLFRYNYGTIQNVGIKDIKIDAVSYEDSPNNPNDELHKDDPQHDNKNPKHEDMSRHGALCMWNRDAATISNVRVSNVDMTIAIKSFVKADAGDGSETHNIGCVVGSNTGKISEVALSGKFSLTVKGDDAPAFKTNVNASVLIGGIVGQNAGMGEIYDISSYEGSPVFNITNMCEGAIGSYSVGGVVGESTATITGVILSNVTIDSSKSKGVTSYIGGIAGQLTVSNELTSTAAVKSCVVGGSVKAGITAPHGAITSGSYIGGIAGAVLGVSVVDSRTAVSVYGSTETIDNVIYATGGAFGRIRENAPTYNFKDLIVYGSALTKPSGSSTMNYIGNFAGIVPQNQSWDDYKDNNIIVKTFDNIQNIGTSLDSNSLINN